MINKIIFSNNIIPLKCAVKLTLLSNIKFLNVILSKKPPILNLFINLIFELYLNYD